MGKFFKNLKKMASGVKELKQQTKKTTSNQPEKPPRVSKATKECGNTIFLNWCDKKTLDVNYPKYFTKTYGLENLAEKHKALLEDGYLEIGSAASQFSSMKVNELKELLAVNNLKVSGKKKELIERLVENNIRPVNEPSFVLSEKGHSMINEHKPWIEYRKLKIDNIISYDNFKKAWNELEKKGFGNPPNFGDIAWNCLGAMKADALNPFNYITLRNIAYYQYIVAKNDESYDAAIEAAIETCCFDLSGLTTTTDYQGNVSHYKSASYLHKNIVEFIKTHGDKSIVEIMAKVYKSYLLHNGNMTFEQMQLTMFEALRDPDRFDYELSEFNKF